MKHLLGFDDELYKGLYVTPLVLDETNRRSLNWHNHNIQEAISELCQSINEKYKKDLKVKLVENIQPGLITFDTANIQLIAKDIHKFLNERGIENRVVYGEGSVSHFHKDIHKCDTGSLRKGTLLPLIGRLTDKLKGKTGVFTAGTAI
jgi:hypothetical protein